MATLPPSVRIPIRHRTSLTVGIVLAAISLTACGGDDSGTDATTTAAAAPATTVATMVDAATTLATPTSGAATSLAPATVPPPPDSADLPVAPPAPVDSSDIVLPPPPDTADVPVVITATVGVDTGPDRIESVPQGSIVSITLSNPDADDEFHLHGYDLGDGQDVAAGESVTYTFTADTAGEFELESHETGDIVLVLRVV